VAERRYNRVAALTAVTSAPLSHHRSVTIVQPQLSSLIPVAERSRSHRYSGGAEAIGVLAEPKPSVFWRSRSHRYSGGAEAIGILAEPKPSVF